MATTRYDESVLAVLVHIEEHLDEPLSLDDLAAVAGFSPHHFHRVFARVTGEAPKAYLRRLRLERAVLRLKVSPDNVLPIALEAGFATHETFTRAFARRFGITPSEFRTVMRGYRDAVGDEFLSETFDGFTDEIPLTLRFDMRKQPLAVERTPGRHLIFARHLGYETLLNGRAFRELWDDVFAFAHERGLDASRALIGITHDDPYVTDEDKIRFDACLEVAAPVEARYPIGYRYLPPGPAVARRHSGGIEAIAETFAYIGVDWLPAAGHDLRAAAPFEIYHFENGERTFTDVYVPLEPAKTTPRTRGAR